ncbi:MAG TPA: acyltransferase family protein [Mesotoga infera]|nr:acyltransferase family protein [Mesotoga infera]
MQAPDASSSIKMDRIAWIDISRGFLMSLVVLFHTLPPQLVADLINPAACTFFFLSGLISRDAPIIFSIKKRFKQLMVPYYFMSLINLGIWLLAWVISKRAELDLPVIDVVWNILLVRTALGIMPFNIIPLWFLPAVFVMEIYYILFKRLKILTIGILVGFVSMFFFRGSLPFKIDVALAVTPYFALGKAMQEKKDRIPKISWPVLLVAFAIYASSSFLCGEVYLMEDYFGPQPLIYIVAALSGIVSIIGVSRIIEKFRKMADFFSRIGRNTLFVLGYHIAAGVLVYPLFDLFGDPIEILRKFWILYWFINILVVYLAIRFLPTGVVSFLSGIFPVHIKRDLNTR